MPINAAFQPEVVFVGAQALTGNCRLAAAFEFASADDRERAADLLTIACEAFAQAGALGAHAMPGNLRVEASMAALALADDDQRKAAMLFTASNCDPKAFQLLRNMLGALVEQDVRLERIRLTVEGSHGEQAVLLPLVEELNESTAYAATAVTPALFDLVWSDSQFSKARRVLVEFPAPLPDDLPVRLSPYLDAWYRLVELGAFCAPFGLPFETESIRGRLCLFDDSSYEISVARFLGSEAGFRVLANMLGHFCRHELAVVSVEID